MRSDLNSIYFLNASFWFSIALCDYRIGDFIHPRQFVWYMGHICRKIKVYFHLCGVLSVGYLQAGIYIDRAHDVFKARYDVFLLDQILPSLSTVQARPTNYTVFVQ